jgi:hypothetical protein
VCVRLTEPVDVEPVDAGEPSPQLIEYDSVESSAPGSASAAASVTEEPSFSSAGEIDPDVTLGATLVTITVVVVVPTPPSSSVTRTPTA